ncbi:serine protease HTRA1B [Patella vulgata]|uniref:serine protease HTRA1B n=1 Tax=Patella vulgata TaxID=6465 RepID=UPI00217F3C58|nr:serine protease HTRA1B [Patella vulgata]
MNRNNARTCIIINSSVILLIALRLINGLRCPPCEKLHCMPNTLSIQTCKGGVTTSICGCCPVCAKVKGERCGGEYEYLGKCDQGLYCQPLKQESNSVVFPGQSDLVGSCTNLPGQQADEGRTSFCRPVCSPTYCKRNPRAICSAINVADMHQECQAQCQHTSCSACSYVKDINCPKCKKNDFRCLKKYGKCIKRNFCTRRKFPCKRKRLKIVEDGKFVCKVPECLDV